MTRIRPALFVLLLVCLYGLVGSMDAADEELMFDRQCEQARLWIQTDGRTGWPPSERFKEVCNDID